MKHWNSKFLERLLQVQETDLKIRDLEFQIQVHHQKSKEEDAELSRLKLRISVVDETLEASESQYQMYSTTLEDIRTAIRGLLTTKSGTPKPRTRSSTEALKIEEEKLGSLVEETSEQIQMLKEERVVLVSKAEERVKDLENSQDGPEAEIKKLETKIRRYMKQREDEVVGMPPMLLKHYDRLRSSRSGIGLTVLRDGVCTICRMQMPTAVISRMNKGENIPVCPACGRMVARVEITKRSSVSADATSAATVKGGTAKKEATKKAVLREKLKQKADGEKKESAKKAESPKAPAKKTDVKKTPVKKVAPKKAAPKKAAPKKAAPKKAPAQNQKAPTTKSSAKKAPAKKAPAKKAPAKNAPPKTPTKKAAKKAAPQKKAAKKSSKSSKNR